MTNTKPHEYLLKKKMYKILSTPYGVYSILGGNFDSLSIEIISWNTENNLKKWKL